MSTILLPSSTLEQLDRIAKSFIWGSTAEQKKQHLVSWERICQPKDEGGLGLRGAKDMNIALLAKLGWRLMTEPSLLWVRVLRCKFGVGDIRDTEWMETKSRWSPTWRSIVRGLKEVVVPGVTWVVGDGSQVRFWKDRWLGPETLLETSIRDIPEAQIDLRVGELWGNGIGWMLPNIEAFISRDTRLQLATVVIDEVTGARDRMSWGQSENGLFSVKSAYRFLTSNNVPRQNMGALFRRIWKVIVPERTRIFLWLVANSAIMTNLERRRRHLTADSSCSLCRDGEESILHVVRDCPATRGIWTRIVTHNRQPDFFSMPLREWLYVNLAAKVAGQDDDWATLFALVIWWSWKWRCGYVFGIIGRCRDRVTFVKDLAKEVLRAHSKLNNQMRSGGTMERLIAWSKPNSGWIKLNTDGASRGNPGLAAAGGVLRDEYGIWCGGFALNVGICTAPLAEIWGVYYGLVLAWEKRVERLEIELDSKLVVEFLTTGIDATHPLSFLVHLCHGFLSRDWCVQIKHVYREANRLADGLANYAFSLPLGLHSFDFIPDVVDPIWKDDLDGLAVARQIRL